MPTDVRPAPPPRARASPPRRPRPSRAPRLHGRMLSRDQVLHVARLARLELTEEELETMAEELSGVLDHIEKIGELGDLADVPPTSHVVEVENALRADEPRPSLPREVVAGRRPRPVARRLPRPEPGRLARRMSELLELTAAQAAEGVRTGTVDPGELWTAYRERALADDAQRVHLGRPARSRRPRSTRNAPLGGVPLAVKDLFCTEGIPSQAGSKILEGYRPPYTATAVERLVARRRAAAGQDAPGRVRDGLLDRELRLRPGAQPVGPLARARRLLRRQRRRGGGRRGAVGDRHRHRRLDPPARRAVRDRRAQADLRRGQPLRDDRLRLLARPGGPVHPRRHRRRAAVRARWWARTRATRPRSRSPSRSGCRRATDLRGIRLGVPERAVAARASSPACSPRSTRRSRSPRPRRRDRRHHAPARAARARRLLPDRPGRGVGQPRPLRRRPLRPARARRRPAGDVRAHARARASAPRSSAASCSAPTRSSSGYYDAYYGRAQKVRTKIAEDFHGRLGRLRLHGLADQPRRRLRARRQDRRPVGDVPQRLLHGADLARRAARHLDPERARRGAADRLPDRRPGVQREPHPRRRPRARARDRLRRARRRAHERLRARHRPRDPRPALDEDEDVLRLRGRLRRGAQHAHLPDLPRPARRAAGAQRARRSSTALHDGAGVRLRDRPAVDLPPQELLLSRQPEGVPDLPVRHPALPGRSRAGRCGCTASISRRTRRSSSTSASRAASTARRRASSTSTAPARRCARSSPSPTSTRPSRRASG